MITLYNAKASVPIVARTLFYAELTVPLGLVCFFDGNGAVDGDTFFAEVAEVAVVGCGCEAGFFYAVLDEKFLYAFNTSLAEALVDIVGAGVVVGPAGEDIFGVGVGFHYFCDSGDYAGILAREAGNTDGVVNCGNGTVVFNFCFNRAVEAVAELSFEVGDACVGSSEASAQSVAVFGFGAYGNNGSFPVALFEEVCHTEVCLKCHVVFIPAGSADVLDAFKTGPAEVERKSDLLAYVE